MINTFFLAAPVIPPEDVGLRQLAALSARLSFALTCFALSWGVFVRTGWLRGLSGSKATTSGHLVFATLALAFGCIHAATFLFLARQPFDVVRLTVPFAEGGLLRHAFGIVGLELMLAIALSTSVRRFLPPRRWLWLHRLAYTALVVIAVHSVFGAVANGHLAVLAVGVVALLLPTAVVLVLRFLPARWLGRAEGSPPPWSGLVVSVDSRRCHQYGVCEREAAGVFQITVGGQLKYAVHPEPVHNEEVRMAARCCPMQAIAVETRR
ncbi:4Fe-4S domain-containing protein [Amycolatopsis anabasis]|uniref:4Fe-4S domain-containing protein n=1 Tax=Amycolatopsis anabasis TaxID=1840409 RepID=UPI001FE5B5C3|nr:ferredoxin [Amycolatopsis anabasis]